jgi:hypothetical protein
MAFANIQLPPNLVLEPMLAELVNKLALDMPSYTFTTKGIATDQLNYHTSKVSVCDRTVAAPEGFDFLKKLKVYKGPEHLGDLFLDRRYSRRGGNDIVYCIKAWRIDNQRGDANTSVTNKITGAARLAKKHFVPQNMTEIMDKATNALSRGMYDACRELSRPISHNQMGPNTLIMQMFLYQTLNGETSPSGMGEVTKAFTSDKYHKAMSEYLLAEKMEKGKYTAIVQHNGAFLIRPNTGEMEYKSFDELPEYMQNSIGVLQLMEDCELVDDVGYRLNDTNFMVLEK